MIKENTTSLRYTGLIHTMPKLTPAASHTIHRARDIVSDIHVYTRSSMHSAAYAYAPPGGGPAVRAPCPTAPTEMVRTVVCVLMWMIAADGTPIDPTKDVTAVRSSSSSSSSSSRPRARVDDEWSRGSAAVLRVDPASFKMTVSISGSEWLVGLPPRLYCNGSWVELRAGKPEIASTVHPRFGSADRISLGWQVGSTAGQVFTTTVLYSNETDSFLFEQQYPAAGCVKYYTEL